MSFESIDKVGERNVWVGETIGDMREHHAVVPFERGALVVSLFEMRRPGLGFRAPHALLDLTGVELRLLKQHLKGGIGSTFIRGG